MDMNTPSTVEEYNEAVDDLADRMCRARETIAEHAAVIEAEHECELRCRRNVTADDAPLPDYGRAHIRSVLTTVKAYAAAQNASNAVFTARTRVEYLLARLPMPDEDEAAEPVAE